MDLESSARPSLSVQEDARVRGHGLGQSCQSTVLFCSVLKLLVLADRCAKDESADCCNCFHS